MPRKAVLVLGAASLVAVGCRSAGGPVPGAPASPSSDTLASYVGQLRILRDQGAARGISMRRGEKAARSGQCDVAVQVRRSAFEKGSARLWLGTVGLPSITGKPSRRGGCRAVPPERLLEITGFGAAVAAQDLTASVDALLETPEVYLASQGIQLDRAATGDPPVAASGEADATSEERELARRVTAWSRNLVAVEPTYYDPSGRVHHEGEIEFVAVVGVDGRVHRAHVVTSLSQAHEELVVRVLSLWRFEPARRGDEPVPSRVSGRTVLRIR